MNNLLLFRVLWKLIHPKRWIFLLMFLVVAILGATSSIDSYLIKNLLDLLDTIDPENNGTNMKQILVWAIIYGLWWEICNFLSIFNDFLNRTSMPINKGEVMDFYFSHLQKHSYSFFKKNLSGSLTNKILDASRACELILSSLNEKILRKIFSMIIAIYALMAVNTVFASIFVIWLAIFFGLSAFFMDDIQRLSSIWANSRSVIAGKIIDSINNMFSIRMHNLYKSERMYLGKYLDRMVNAEVSLNWFMLRIRYFQGLTCSIMIFCMIYALGMYKARGQISIGDVALVITLATAILDDIWDFIQDVGDLFEDIGSFIQTLDLLEDHEIQNEEDSKPFDVVEGSIEFKEVSFGYKSSAGLFDKISINIPAKQKVGIVGYSGSGKTTFINLITRMYDTNQGSILVDGQDIKEISQDQLRKNISIIPQDVSLFNRTIIENIRYGKKDATDEEIYLAAKKAKIHDDILKFPQGYDTIAGEKGNNLSGGQRQRIIIARAILKNAPILILDEATSAQDSITEEYIKESIALLMQNTTSITISHKISTLKNMDRIILFDSGKIVADGNHQTLYQNSELYKKLWDAQF